MDKDQDLLLTFRMDRVEKDVERLEKDVERLHSLIEKSITEGTASRVALTDLMGKIENVTGELSKLTATVAPMIEDFRERHYGHDYVIKFFTNSKYFIALGIAVGIYLILPSIPSIIKLFQ